MNTQTLITNYKSFLEKNHSKITVKNYLSDINHFIQWFAKNYSSSFSPDLLDKNVVEEYKNANNSSVKDENAQFNMGRKTLSFMSLKRHLSSLRLFSAYLIQEGYATKNPFEETQEKKTIDPWRLYAFKNYLYENNASKLTIKYYINDMNAFIRWYAESVKQPSPTALPTLTSEILEEYTNRLKETLLLSPKSINRKLSSIRRYLAFMQIYTASIENVQPEIENLPVKIPGAISLSEVIIPEQIASNSNIPPVRLLKRMINPYLEFENKTASLLSTGIIKSRLKNTFQNQTKPTSQMMDNLVRGLSGKNIKKEFYAPYSVSIDSYPIHKKVVFHLKHTRPEWYKRYHSYPFVHYLHFGVLMITAFSASFFIYHVVIGSANADQGLMSRVQNRTFVFKGKLFDQNHKPITNATNLRLGLYTSPTASGSALTWEEVQNGIKTDPEGNITIVVGNKNPISDSLLQGNNPMYLGITVNDGEELSPREELGVPYANNSEQVQGLAPITYSDKQSNVLLALNGSGNLSIGGSASPTFEATGGNFTLSGQTVILTTNASSDGNVVINPDGNGKIDLEKPLINSSGAVTVEGGFNITATTSAIPAFSINQNNGGPLISASTMGSTRFLVDSQGTITTGVWAGSPISTQFGGFGANITPSSPGELLYSTSTSAYGHLSAGIAGQCLTSEGYNTPLWSNCGYLSQLNGVLSMTNTNLDLLLGGTSTGSARFSFTNMNSGSPTFKVGGTLSITGDNLIQADNSDLKLGGNTTKNILLAQAGGNVGVGTINPSRSLDINGTLGGNVDYYTDGAGSQTIVRGAKALIYDLEKDTGSTNSSTTTIYNIVGLPEMDGTIAFIYAKVSKGTTDSPQTQNITLQVNGAQIATVSTLPSPTLNDPSSVVKHFTLTRSNGTWHLIGNPDASDTADMAEWTPYAGTTPLPGGIVSIDESGKVTNSTSAYNFKIAGVVSTNPNITIGEQSTDSIRLALSGRVPVIITSLTGSIQSGDSITSSPLSGTGMKLNQTGPTVGHALETFTPDSACTEVNSIEEIVWPRDDGKNTAHPCFKVQVKSLTAAVKNQVVMKYGLSDIDYIYISKVMTLVNPSWSSANDLIASIDSAKVTVDAPIALDGDLLSQIDALQEASPVVTVGGNVISNIQAFGGLVAGKIKAGTVIATNIATQNLSAASATISDLTANTIRTNSIVSPLAAVDTLKTNTITTNGSDNLTVNLPSSSSAVIIKNGASNKEVARIDSSGNASFSGSLTSQSVQTQNATVSGTLHAGNIVADNISGLDAAVSSFAAQFAASTLPPPSISSHAFSTATISAQFGTFYDGLLSLGASTFGNLSVMDQLSVGTSLTFSQNSINTLGTDLNIQPLRQGAVSFLAGAVRIESDGQLTVNENATFNKDVTVKGKLYAGIISPLPDTNVQVELPDNSNLTISNASKSAVLVINNHGDITSSGSGTFNKLNFNLVGQAIASGSVQATASGSAGTAILKTNTTELTIVDPLVTKDSLVYVTPANNTNNNVLYLMRQTANTNDGPIGSFTIGISQPIPQDTLFNWLIVN